MTDGQATQTQGGVVIPFPPMPTRLERALQALARAAEEQQAAVAAWRDSLAELRDSMIQLSGSLHAYRSTLAETAGEVAGLGAQARRLEEWADRSV